MQSSSLVTLFSLLFIPTCVDAVPYSFSDQSPSAPLPRDGSAHPARNTNTLSYQICGLVGGYLVTVLIWGILLLTVGRRMKRRTQTSPKSLDLELVPTRLAGHTIASPSSARSATSWFKKGFKRNSDQPADSVIGSPQSPTAQSPGSFDQRVLDADRERAQAEMERLYAAVMDHDRKKSSSQVSSEEMEPRDQIRRLPAINTTRDMSTHSNPSSPMKAIYPPNYLNGPPTAPLPTDRLRDQQPPPSPRSILSKKSHTSEASTSGKSRFNLKNLRISGPIQKYPGEHLHDEARTPLSPRFYNPGAPPSPPTQQSSPITPYSRDLEYEQLDQVQPLPRPAPQRLGSHPEIEIHTANSPGGRSTNSASSASNNNSLPLRGFAEPLKSPDLRTTVLDRRLDKLSLQTPKTGVPYTPYSPYMPFTPVTPVTPHLVTKKERKSRTRMGGRKVADRDDMVQSPKDIFGDAY